MKFSISNVQIHEPQHTQKRSSNYSCISYELRKTLIKNVIEQKWSIYRASKELGVHNSTAKAIIRNYRKNGHIFKKKRDQQQDFVLEDKKSKRKILEVSSAAKEQGHDQKIQQENRPSYPQNQPRLAGYPPLTFPYYPSMLFSNITFPVFNANNIFFIDQMNRQ